jgi:hypothetical protein
MSDQSPFFDDIKDEAERERSKLHAKTFYEQAGRLRAEAHSGHVEYGKWLIASLLAVHGGAIFAISGLKDSIKPEQISGLIDAAAWNLGGIFLTLLAGFGAWLNFQFAHSLYERWENPAVLYRNDKYPTSPIPGAKWVNATLYGAAAVGIASSLCFVASAVCVVWTLK